MTLKLYIRTLRDLADNMEKARALILENETPATATKIRASLDKGKAAKGAGPKKPHWASTPEGRRRLSLRMKAVWRERAPHTRKLKAVS